MPILKLTPCCKNYLWGGSKLKTIFEKASDDEVLAETWELSCHNDGESRILGGDFNGITLSEYIKIQGRDILGSNCARLKDFPILIKLIDAKENLSVQVHPGDEYAFKTEGQYGKTEMWYIVNAEDGAFIYYGFSKKVSSQEFKKRIEEGTLLEVLRQVPVKSGDAFFIEAGTIHAIGAGIIIAEIQQSSNLTYRVFDYGRLGTDGKPRALHIEKALEVTCLEPQNKADDFGKHLVKSAYFEVDKIDCEISYRDSVDKKTFHHLLILEGRGYIATEDEVAAYKAGDSILICAGTGDYIILGKCLALKTSVPEN